MKLPELPKRKPKAQASSASNIQAPAFLQDLYKDMRDRRLLIPAVALLIGIVAVPLLLSSSAASPVAPPAISDDPSAVAVEPAVLTTQEVGVRDYRQRLADLESKNPFGDQFKPKEPKKDKLDDAEEVDSGTSGGAVGAGGTTSTGSSGSTGTTGTTPTPPTGPTEPMVIVSRIDAVTKIVGRKQEDRHENVHSGDVLPSRQAPVVLFLRNLEGGELAEFIVSRNVSNVNGEGTCKPGKSNCEFLTLKDGETAYLRYADGNRYRLTVTDIRFEQIPESEFDPSDN